MKRRYSIALGFALLALAVHAQDPHFTQFHLLPQMYNAGRIGLFDGDFRTSAHYRRQWASVGEGFTTQAFQLDGALIGKGPTGDRLGVGLLVLNDQAGLADFRVFQIKAGIAYHIQVSQNDRMSLGLQAGYLHRNISMDGLAWDAQYNGSEYDPSLPTMESQFSVPIVRGFDLGSGVNWSHRTREFEWYAGYGFRHLGQNQTHLQNGEDRLPLRQSLQAGLVSRLPNVWFYADALVQRQRGAMEIMASVRGEIRLGSDSRYTDVYKSSAILTGLASRAGEAISPMIGFEWKRMATISLSYDLPLSDVRRITGLGGGPEITLIYLGDYGKKREVVK
jgi:type IX secretion system PorP/SprF family membrane protein